MSGRPVKKRPAKLMAGFIIIQCEPGQSRFWPRAQESVQAPAIHNVSKQSGIAPRRIAFLVNGMNGLPVKKRPAKLMAGFIIVQREPGLSRFRPRAQKESVQEDFRKNGVACRKERSRRIAFRV